jgi:hypothetical protein
MKITKQRISFIMLLANLLLSWSILNIILPVPVVRAADLWDSQVGMGSGEEIDQAFQESGSQPEDIRVIVARLVKAFLALLGIIFLILVIVAGARWMTSSGNEQVLGEAKRQITAAIIGLIIILMAYTITSYVSTCVYNLSRSATAAWLCP